MAEKNIVLVDGFKIRNTLDDDFGLYHTHDSSLAAYMPKFYIPSGETWVDHTCKDEIDFLIAVDAFFESDSNASYEELRERAKKHFRPEGPVPEHVRRSEKRDSLTIQYVDGEIVRKYYDPEFILGGHDLVYDYIHKNEIWLDEKMDPKEIPYVLEHELVERKRMEEGEAYHIAHEFATVADKKMRRSDGSTYPGDPTYPWRGRSDNQIIKEHYVVQN